MTTLSDADQALCVAYVDGLLDEPRRIAFELRLAQEPELAGALRSLLGTDELVRRLAATERVDVERARRARPWLWAASLAAAAVALFAIGLYSLQGGRRATFEVALAPGFESARDYLESLPELSGLRPPGVDALRGADEPPNVDAAAFAERAAAAEFKLAGQALAARRTALEGGFFVIPIELGEASAVVAYGVDSAGSVTELYPGERGDAAALLPAGLHVLPQARFESTAEGGAPRLRYTRGFLVPLGAGALDVVVGVRRGAMTAEGRKPAVDDAHSAEAVAAGLEAARFRVLRLKVCEPR